MRPTTIPSLGEKFRELLVSVDTLLDPSLFDLQDTPDTDIVTSRLNSAREDYARLIASNASPRLRKSAEIAVSSLERQMIYAVRRDGIQLDRPPGCWCLGAGGRHPVNVPMPTAETYTLQSTTGDGAHDGEERSYTEPYEVLREYCDACQDGQSRRKRDDRTRQMSRSWQSALRIRRMFGESKIPKEYQRHQWRALPKPNAVRQASDWLDDPGEHPWLFLHGEPGRGKTTILYGIASEIVKMRSEAVLCRPMPDLLSDIRSTWNPNNPNEETDLIKLVKSVPWLFIDELGAEIPKDWVGERLYQILNHRHDEHLPTVLASNLGPSKMLDHLGERLWGRVKRMALPVFVGGRDLRDLPHGETPEIDPNA